MKLFSKDGMTLVGTLVAAGIIGGLALVIMRIVSVQVQSSKKMFQNETILQTISEINTLLTNEEVCTKSLTDPTPANISSGYSDELTIYRKDGTDDFEPRFDNDANKKISTSIDIESIKARKNPDNPIGDDERGGFQLAVSFKLRSQVDSFTTKYWKIGRRNCSRLHKL